MVTLKEATLRKDLVSMTDFLMILGNINGILVLSAKQFIPKLSVSKGVSGSFVFMLLADFNLAVA